MAKKVEIKNDPRNVNNHNDRGKAAVKKSLEELGAGRSIVTDSDGTIIGGECTFEQAKELGIPIKVVNSDGNQLIVVRRTDLGPDDPRRRMLAIADNKTSQLSGFDFAKLTVELQELSVEGVDLDPTGFADFELRPLLADEWTEPPPSPPPGETQPQAPVEPTVGPQSGTSEPQSGETVSHSPDTPTEGRQSGGRAIFFGQDQLEYINGAIAFARKETGDEGEASEAECLIWCILQLNERVTVERQSD